MQTPLGHVFLVDDNPDIRFYLSELLRQLGYTVEAYEDAERFLAQSLHLTPAVVVLDMRMGGLSGLDVQRRLKELERPTPIIFISGESRSQEIIDAMKGGAIDFLCKPFNIDELIAAIDKALAIDTRLKDQYVRLSALRRRFRTLTAREQELLALVLEGHPNRNISELTGVQAGTVKKHRAAILGKMGAPDTAALIAAFKGIALDRLRD